MSRSLSHLVLFAGLVLVSTSGPFLVSAGMDAYAVVFLRLAFAGPLFLIWAATRGTLRIPSALLGQVVLGAALLTAHFLLWVKAFDLTDYASNLLLLVTQPVVAAVLGARLGERTSVMTWISVALAVTGLLVIAHGDFALGPRALLGDALCVLAAVAVTVFFVVTRTARAELPLPVFMGWTLLLGAGFALPVALLSGGNLFDHPPAAWGWLAALVVFTTLGGHGLLNLAARHVKLFTLNVVIVLEPPLAIAMGAPLFGASVTPLQVAGGVVLALAVIVGLQSEPVSEVEVEPA